MIKLMGRTSDSRLNFSFPLSTFSIFLLRPLAAISAFPRDPSSPSYLSLRSLPSHPKIFRALRAHPHSGRGSAPLARVARTPPALGRPGLATFPLCSGSQPSTLNSQPSLASRRPQPPAPKGRPSGLHTLNPQPSNPPLTRPPPQALRLQVHRSSPGPAQHPHARLEESARALHDRPQFPRVQPHPLAARTHVNLHRIT